MSVTLHSAAAAAAAVLTFLTVTSALLPQPNDYRVISAVVNTSSIVFDPLTSNLLVADAFNSRCIVISSSGMMIDQFALPSPQRIVSDPISGAVYTYSRLWPISQLLKTSRTQNGTLTTDTFGPIVSGVVDMRVDQFGIVHILYADSSQTGCVLTVSSANVTRTQKTYDTCRDPTHIAVDTPTVPYVLSDIYLLCRGLPGSVLMRIINQTRLDVIYVAATEQTHVDINRYSHDIVLMGNDTLITIIDLLTRLPRTVPTSGLAVAGFAIDDRFANNFTMFVMTQTLNNTLLLNRYNQDGRMILPTWTPLPQSIPPLNSPRQLTADSVGTMYVADSLNRVLRLSIQDGRQLTPPISEADGLTFGPIIDIGLDHFLGTLYILDSHQRLVIADTSGTVRTMRNTTMMTAPVSMTVCIPSTTAYVYILQPSINRYKVLRYDDRSRNLMNIIPINQIITTATIISSDQLNFLYFLLNFNTIRKYDLITQVFSNTYKLPNNVIINDMIVASNGNVFLLYENGQNVAMFSSDGALVSVMSTVGMTSTTPLSLSSLATDPAGLWLFGSDNQTNRIIMFSIERSAPYTLSSSSTASRAFSSSLSSSRSAQQQTSRLSSSSLSSSSHELISSSSSPTNSVITLNCHPPYSGVPQDTYIGQLGLDATLSTLYANDTSGSFPVRFATALAAIVGIHATWTFPCVAANATRDGTAVQFLIYSSNNTLAATYARRLIQASAADMSYYLYNNVYARFIPYTFQSGPYYRNPPQKPTANKCSNFISCYWSTIAAVTAMLVICISALIARKCYQTARTNAAIAATKNDDIDLNNLANSNRYKYTPTIPMPRVSFLSNTINNDYSNNAHSNNAQHDVAFPSAYLQQNRLQLPLLDEHQIEGQ